MKHLEFQDHISIHKPIRKKLCCIFFICKTFFAWL